MPLQCNHLIRLESNLQYIRHARQRECTTRQVTEQLHDSARSDDAIENCAQNFWLFPPFRRQIPSALPANSAGNSNETTAREEACAAKYCARCYRYSGERQAEERHACNILSKIWKKHTNNASQSDMNSKVGLCGDARSKSEEQLHTSR